jgi:hypothetical protein
VGRTSPENRGIPNGAGVLLIARIAAGDRTVQ